MTGEADDLIIHMNDIMIQHLQEKYGNNLTGAFHIHEND
jgi:hypothetical protein